MRIEIQQDTFGYLIKVNDAGEEFGYAIQRLKDLIDKNCRHYIGERRQWRVELRAEDDLRLWLAEMGELGASFVDLNAKEQERIERVESGGSDVRARLLVRRALMGLHLRPTAPAILREAAYTVLRSQTQSDAERIALDTAIRVIRANGYVESDAA